MAARGAVAKEQITNQILSQFEGAFKYDKEIRIPVVENGETIQIKVTLTAAKTNVAVGGDTALPGEPVLVPGGGFDEMAGAVSETKNEPVAPTQEEKDNVAKLVASLF